MNHEGIIIVGQRVQLKKTDINNSLPILILAEHAVQLVQCLPPGLSSSWKTRCCIPPPGLRPPVFQQLHHILKLLENRIKSPGCSSCSTKTYSLRSPLSSHNKFHPWWNHRITQERPSMLGRHRTSEDNKSYEGLLEADVHLVSTPLSPLHIYSWLSEGTWFACR